MKKSIFYLMAVLALLFTASCQKDEDPAGEETNVTFTTDLSGNVLSRAIADGLTVDKLVFAVYDESGTEIPALRQYVAVAGKAATVSTRLVSGKKYSFVFFAYKASTGNASVYYDLTDLKSIKVSTDYSVNKGNDEARDAFFAFDTETITASLSKTITLRRPFSQLNVIANDIAAAEASNVKLPVKADVTVSNVYTTLNALTGEVADPQAVTIPAGADITEGITVAGTTYDSKAYVAMNYLLMPSTKDLTDCSIKIMDNADATLATISIPNVPVQRNYRTNIIGSLLTNSSQFNIIIDPEFETPDYDELVWSGNIAKELPTAVDGKIHITTGDQLAYMITTQRAYTDPVVLDNNINMSGIELNPDEFTAGIRDLNFDGQGHTISNVKVIGKNNNHGYAGLFTWMIGGSIKNLTLANADIEAKSFVKDDNNCYAGAFAAITYGNVTFENLTAKNCTVKGVNKVGGILGFQAENAATITNCTVDGCTIVTDDTQADHGQCGGILGYVATGATITGSKAINTAINAAVNTNDGESTKRYNGVFVGTVANATLSITLPTDPFAGTTLNGVAATRDMLVGGTRSGCTANITIQ